MAVTGDIFRSLTFDGESSRDYGVYITGQAVYNAPERDVEMVTIPGRNGAFALDKGRFENIEVTYPAGVFANTDTEFAKAISDFRNMLCSRQGYCRLTDEYNPDEYRLAVYKSGLEVDPVQLKAGQFDITFECKPQRYLTSGEEKKVLGTWGDTETKTGEIVELDNDGTLAVKSAEVALEPQQDLHGYDKPWSGGNGKNKWGGLKVEKLNSDQSTSASTSDWHSPKIMLNGATSLALTIFENNSTYTSGSIGFVSYNSSGTVLDDINFIYANQISTYPTTVVRTLTSGASYMYLRGYRSAGASGIVDIKAQLEFGSVATSYEPYENICPITGASDVDVNVADDYDDPQTLNTYTTSLGTTVYGGSVDVVAGTGTEEYGVLVFDGTQNLYTSGSAFRYYDAGIADGDFTSDPNVISSWLENKPNSAGVPSFGQSGSANNHNIYFYNATSISGVTDLASFKTYLSNNPLTVVYKKATPTALTLTPTPVNLIEGTNYVFSPQGEITLEYGTNPNYIVNPTLFGCGPLIEAKGYGDIQFNGYTIKLANGAIGTVNLWQETRGGTFNGSITKTFVTGQFEPTDTFSFTVTHMFTLSEVNPSITNTNANATNSRDIGVGWEITYRIDLPCTFTVGTTGQITNTSTYDFGSGKKVISDMDVSYDSTTGTVVYTVATTTQGQPSFEGTKHGFSISECNAVSTLNRLGNPTYIDCDLGEAYKINDGDVVSLNSFVDLGSKLPELAPGINEFTVSNTFTEVAVVPRWWRI